MRTTGAAGRRTGAILFAALLCVLGALAPAAPAAAHASLISTDPTDGSTYAEAPDRVTLEFSEPVSVAAPGLRIFSAEGDPLDLHATALDSTVSAALPDLEPDARYVIAWQVISSDAHVISGTISFAVGDAPAGGQPAVDPADDGAAAAWGGAASAAQLLGLLVVAGILLFEIVALRGRLATRASRIVLLVAATTGALGAIAVAALTAARAGGPTWPSSVGALLAVLSAAMLWVPAGATSSPRGGPLRIGRLVVALLALASPVLVGHSASKEPRWLVVASDLVHLGAGAIWFGGLIGLALVLLSARRPGTGGEPAVDSRSAAQVLARFAALAAASAAALLVTGTVMAVVILGAWDALLGTTYGRILLLKLGLVAVALALAAWTRRRIVPAIAARPERSAAWTLLRGQVIREAVIIGAVVVLTGVLIGQSPNTGHGDHAAGGATAVEAVADGLSVSATVSTADGTTMLAFTIVDDEGAPIEPIEPPTVSARLPAQDLGPITRPAEPAGAPGAFVAELDLPVAGEWTIDIGIRLSAFEQRTVRVSTTAP